MLKKILESAMIGEEMWRNNPWKKWLILSIGFFILVVALIIYLVFKPSPIIPVYPPDEIKITMADGPIYYSQLTGLPVDSEAEIVPAVVGVMVNNNPEGYPLSGLKEAPIVYEAPVEGSVTRFMAIFPVSSTVAKLGPVRSARPYYLDWLSEFGEGLYMHCGGSKDGLAEIKNRHIFDADEFFNAPYYWRDQSRYAPHNLYTNAEKWQAFITTYTSQQLITPWVGWLFGDLNVTNTEPIKKIAVTFSPRFILGWEYNELDQNYTRTVNQEVFLETDGEPIIMDNIIVQFADVRVLDEVGRREITTIDEEEARIFRDGVMIRGTWKKTALSERTRFFDSSGVEVVLKPGQTWIMIVPKGLNLTVGN